MNDHDDSDAENRSYMRHKMVPCEDVTLSTRKLKLNKSVLPMLPHTPRYGLAMECEFKDAITISRVSSSTTDV
jgi:hypothetical protein